MLDMIECLIEYQENDLSKEVIVPLFKKIFNSRVEFTGGGIEKGRDILVYKKDEFGFNDFIGVQVKKLKATPNSSTNSFQQLLVQLTQMKSEGVVDQFTGQKVKLSNLIFVTPYQISDRSFDSHTSAYKAVLDIGVKIIDGQHLLGLIKENMPEIIHKITGDKSYIGEKVKMKLSNEVLMSALNFNTKKKLCDIFCETSLIAGNRSKGSENVHSYYKVRSHYFELDIPVLDEAIKHDQILQKELGTHFFEKEGLKLAIDSFSELKHLENDIRLTTTEIEKVNSTIIRQIVQSKFRDKYPTQKINIDLEKFIKSDYEKIELKDDKLEFLKEIISLNSHYECRAKLIEKNKLNRTSKDDIKLKSVIKVNNREVCNRYNDKVGELFNFRDTAKFEVKRYLLLSKSIELCKRVIESYPKCFVESDLVTSLSAKAPRISIDSSFDTNLNIIVLGEAGSGKTTNLQVYSQKLYKNREDGLVIYMTLNELALMSLNNGDHSIVVGLKNYLHNLGLTDYTSNSLLNQLKCNDTKLILDSVDEAIVEYNWIVTELKNFAETFVKCQIITSSRFTVAQISELDFVNISLLPFDRQQKEEFFNKWFNSDTEKVDHH
jgi:hypothetical protein